MRFSLKWLPTLMAFVVLATGGRAAASDGDSAEASARVAELIATLQKTEAAVESLQTEYLCLSKHQFVRPGEKLPANWQIADDAYVAMIRRVSVKWEMMRDGRGRMEAVLQRTNIRHDGTESNGDDEVLSTFDGKVGKFYHSRTWPDGRVVRSGILRDKLQRTHDTPYDLTIYHLGNPISKVLLDGQAVFVREEVWEERPIFVLQVQPVVASDNNIYQQQFWIDAERGVAVRRELHVQRGKGKPWALRLRIDGTKYTEAAPGVWLPGAAEKWRYVVTGAGQDYLARQDTYAVTSWTVNGSINPARFSSQLPVGESIIVDGILIDAPRPSPFGER